MARFCASRPGPPTDNAASRWIQATGIITDQSFDSLPEPYRVARYGSSPDKVAITFDDGPDPEWTPKILDVLKREQAPAAFFLIGIQADKFSDITDRIYREGHEIGNHTFTHPDISNISKRIHAGGGTQSYRAAFCQPPGHPHDSVPPALFDRRRARHRRPGPPPRNHAGHGLHHHRRQDRSQRLARQSAPQRRSDRRPTCWPTCRPARAGDIRCGNIILLHDGGGDREQTVLALPQNHRGRAGKRDCRSFRFTSCWAGRGRR